MFCTRASHPHTDPKGTALFYACPLPVARPINGLSAWRSGPDCSMPLTCYAQGKLMPLMVCPEPINHPVPSPMSAPLSSFTFTCCALRLQETDCKMLSARLTHALGGRLVMRAADNRNTPNGMQVHAWARVQLQYEAFRDLRTAELLFHPTVFCSAYRLSTRTKCALPLHPVGSL